MGMEAQGETSEGIQYHVVTGSFIEEGNTFTEWSNTTQAQRLKLYRMLQTDLIKLIALEELPTVKLAA